MITGKTSEPSVILDGRTLAAMKRRQRKELFYEASNITQDTQQQVSLQASSVSTQLVVNSILEAVKMLLGMRTNESLGPIVEAVAKLGTSVALMSVKLDAIKYILESKTLMKQLLGQTASTSAGNPVADLSMQASDILAVTQPQYDVAQQ